MKPRVADHIASLIPYPPGKPIEELERVYGIKGSIKLASNENPLGPSPKALAAISGALTRLHRYPDGSGYYLRQKISEKFSVPFEGIVLGNGSNELLDIAVRTYMGPGDEAVMASPSFVVYAMAVRSDYDRTLIQGQAAPTNKAPLLHPIHVFASHQRYPRPLGVQGLRSMDRS